MKILKTTLAIAISTSMAAFMLVSCGSDNDSSQTSVATPTPAPTPDSTPTPAARFSSFTSSATNGGGEVLIDSTANLTWVNDTVLDSNRDGCLSPPNIGGTPEPIQTNGFCDNMTYAGFNDWRSPTSAELTTFITSAIAANAEMKYLNPLCPALVGTDGIVRTENANPAITNVFPNAQAGDVLGTARAVLQGVGADIRCVRDGINTELGSRFSFARASAEDREGRTLVDTQTNLEWINQTGLDSQGDGCVSPGAVGTTKPDTDAVSVRPDATSRCVDQNFAGHNDWRAPTGAELATIIRDTAAADDGVALKYLVAGCPANVSTENFIRTENDGNPAVASAFPNSSAGDVLATALASMTVNGRLVPSGVRCVRDVTTP